MRLKLLFRTFGGFGASLQEAGDDWGKPGAPESLNDSGAEAAPCRSASAGCSLQTRIVDVHATGPGAGRGQRGS